MTTEERDPPAANVVNYWPRELAERMERLIRSTIVRGVEYEPPLEEMELVIDAVDAARSRGEIPPLLELRP